MFGGMKLIGAIAGAFTAGGIAGWIVAEGSREARHVKRLVKAEEELLRKQALREEEESKHRRWQEVVSTRTRAEADRLEALSPEAQIVDIRERSTCAREAVVRAERQVSLRRIARATSGLVWVAIRLRGKDAGVFVWFALDVIAEGVVEVGSAIYRFAVKDAEETKPKVARLNGAAAEAA